MEMSCAGRHDGNASPLASYPAGCVHFCFLGWLVRWLRGCTRELCRPLRSRGSIHCRYRPIHLQLGTYIHLLGLSPVCFVWGEIIFEIEIICKIISSIHKMYYM